VLTKESRGNGRMLDTCSESRKQERIKAGRKVIAHYDLECLEHLAKKEDVTPVLIGKRKTGE